MSHSTCCPTAAAIPLTPDQLAALRPVFALLGQFAQALLDFQAAAASPQATADLEGQLADLLRQVGRAALERTLNSLEPDEADQVPATIKVGTTRYRRRDKSGISVDCTFGTFRLRRWLYEPADAGEACLFPLHHLLGLVAGRATPALADRVGRLVAQHSQREALAILAQENGLRWSAATLRKVSAGVAFRLGPHRQHAQAEQVLDWLRQALRGRGPHEPVLAVGRDGIMVPLRPGGPQEAAVATVAVYDRRGQRLGTVYLGWMPQAEQVELSRQLTALLNEVLQGWKGQRPRLVYVTDGGWHPEEYYRGVLRRMVDPRTGQTLCWQRVLDYYHAAGYVTKLAEALFVIGWQQQQWARRMRRVLKQDGGLTRLLQSAAYHRNQHRLRGSRQEEFRKASRYLAKRRKLMDYARYRRQGLPIGSGVTEAGCKVLVSQRLKRSGMGWKRPGGQVVLTLRCVWLSGIWARAWNAHLCQPCSAHLDSYAACLSATTRAAA